MKTLYSSIILIYFCNLCQAVVAADIPFNETIVANACPTDPWEKAWADIDGDGYLDALIGTPTGPVIWYAYPDWTPTNICNTGGYNSACGIATADIDGDGDNDVVMGGITWFENPGPLGNPSTDTWEPHTVGTHKSHDLICVDIDKDGLIDILSRHQGTSGNEVRIYKQNTPDSWTMKSLPAVAGEGIDIADIDGDKDMDIVIADRWYENTLDIVNGTWNSYSIAPSFDQVAITKTGDINGDGRPDVVITGSEQVYRISWFECPLDPKTGAWTEHELDQNLNSAHGLGIADMDGDGDNDIVAAEFRGEGRLMVYKNDDGKATSFTMQVLGNTNLHNIQLDDIEKDGDIDILGAYCWDNEPAYAYINQSGPYILTMDDWTYIELDNSRAATAMGLGLADGTGDGFADIASGDYFYRNPGNDMSGTWIRTNLPGTGDANYIADVDGDEFCDILSQSLPGIYWYEAADEAGSTFTAKEVATGITATNHGSSQGFALAQIRDGGKDEYLFTSGNGIYYLEIPANPETDTWPLVHVTANAPEEGIATADIDNDGDIDIVGWVGTGTGSNSLGFWENPGDGSDNWTGYAIGTVTQSEGDRIETGDFNGDGFPDVAATGTTNGTTGSSVYWFQNPGNPKTNTSWSRISVADNMGAMNSLDVADMNNDGMPDIITGEHRGSLTLNIWENVDSAASWSIHTVGVGIENHLGARVRDMDGDGDLDIVGIAWDGYQKLHLWRNNARSVMQNNTTDSVAPTITRVTALLSGTTLQLTFSEAVEETSATNTGNYTINGQSVQSAILGNGGSTVFLTIAPGFTNGNGYSIQVAGVEDMAGNQIQVTDKNFTYDTDFLSNGLIGYWKMNENTGTYVTDFTGNNADAEITGAVWTGGKYQSALAFDEGNDHLDLGPVDITSGSNQSTALTISLWMNPASFAISDARLISKSTSANEQDHIWMLSTINDGGSKLRFRLKTGGITTTLIASTGIITLNQWHLVVASYDGTFMKLYLDGVEVGTTAKSGTIDIDNTLHAWVGNNPGTQNQSFDGAIDDVRIYNTALTGQEIEQLYNYEDDLIEQTITLNQGWNMVSLFVTPLLNDVLSVFPNATTVKTADNFFNSSQDEYMNGLKYIEGGAGYFVYNTVAEILTISGAETQNPATLQINTGWNLMASPYKTTTPFANDLNDTNCQIVKNFDGYWEPNGTTNSIQNFEPGKAYYILK